MYEKELQNLGLSEKEAKVYTTALELGPDTVQNIAKQSGINRATTYVQIGSLKDKGLMSEFEKGKKTYFVAESPDRLKNLLSSIEKELAVKKTEAASIIPGLLSLFEGMGERPKVRFFEGLEGSRAMHQDLLTTKNKVTQGFLCLDDLFSFFPEYQHEFTDYRIKKKISSHVIYTQKGGPREDAVDKNQLRIAKYLPPDKFPINGSITLYDDKVAITTYKGKPIGVIIEDKTIADTVKAIFYWMWENIK
jgi:HTH-type transcriptional regulator, sugar sensing transcriptional regulator